jgi:divalent metal cation (Fe/Co/Zn/Cd) transporter
MREQSNILENADRLAGIIVTIGFAAIKESSAMLVDACNGECIERGSAIKGLAEDVKGVEKAHVVRLRQSGPVFQGELEIKVPCDLTVRQLNKIKSDIRQKIKDIFPEVERLTITTIEEGDLK